MGFHRGTVRPRILYSTQPNHGRLSVQEPQDFTRAEPGIFCIYLLYLYLLLDKRHGARNKLTRGEEGDRNLIYPRKRARARRNTRGPAEMRTCKKINCGTRAHVPRLNFSMRAFLRVISTAETREGPQKYARVRGNARV